MPYPHRRAADLDAFPLDDTFDSSATDDEFDEELDRQLAAYREALADFRNL